VLGRRREGLSGGDEREAGSGRFGLELRYALDGVSYASSYNMNQHWYTCSFRDSSISVRQTALQLS